MKTKNIVGHTARQAAARGVAFVGNAVRSTIGPFGMNFTTPKKGGVVTNDGFSIATALIPSIEDEFERMGANLAHEASSKTNDQVGDATSTSWAFIEAIVKEVEKYLPNENTIKAQKNSAEIITWIKESKDEVIRLLKEKVTPVTSEDELVASARVSAEDEGLAKLIGETQWRLGAEGIVMPEEANQNESTVEIVRGIRTDNGFSSPFVVTNPETGSLELRNVSTLLTNYTIGIEELRKLRELFAQMITEGKTALVFVGRAFTEEAIKFCSESQKQGFQVFPINAPYTDQSEVMKDIEAVVGGRYFDTYGAAFEPKIEDVGFAERLSAKRFESIVAGADTPASQMRVGLRVADLKKALGSEESDFYKKMIEGRIAQLSSGFAILHVGSRSITNRRRLKDKADDAVGATRFALRGGTVRGAGIALKEVSDALPDTNILKRPLRCVYDQIVLSAPVGWVAEEWVRDPYIVLEAALENACDVAGSLASVNGMVVNIDQEKLKVKEVKAEPQEE